MILEIKFKDKKLRELCEKKAAAVKKLGDVSARKLQTRLADMAAALRVTDLRWATRIRSKGIVVANLLWIWQADGAWFLRQPMTLCRSVKTHLLTGPP